MKQLMVMLALATLLTPSAWAGSAPATNGTTAICTPGAHMHPHKLRHRSKARKTAHGSHHAVPAAQVPQVATSVAPLSLPSTPAESAFVSRPEFQSAPLKGRLVPDLNGFIRFDNGDIFIAAVQDPVSKLWLPDFSTVYRTRPYWGSLAYCNTNPGAADLFDCWVLSHDVVIDLETTRRSKGEAL